MCADWTLSLRKRPMDSLLQTGWYAKLRERHVPAMPSPIPASFDFPSSLLESQIQADFRFSLHCRWASPPAAPHSHHLGRVTQPHSPGKNVTSSAFMQFSTTSRKAFIEHRCDHGCTRSPWNAPWWPLCKMRPQLLTS